MSGNAEAWVKTIESFNQTGSFEAAVETMDAAFTIHPSTGGDFSGRDASRAALETMRNERQWSHSEVRGATGSGDWVSVIYRHTFGQTTVTGASVVRFNAAGRAIEMWSHAVDDNAAPG